MTKKGRLNIFGSRVDNQEKDGSVQTPAVPSTPKRNGGDLPPATPTTPIRNKNGLYPTAAPSTPIPNNCEPTLSPKSKIRESREQRLAEAKTLVIPNVCTQSGLTSKQAARVLANFLLLSEEERDAFFGFSELELFDGMKERIKETTQKRKGVKHIESPHHKRSRRHG